jgi:C_GCAxxG_C_C family probable redox protein
MESADTALKLFRAGSNCAQSVVRAFAARLGVDENTGLRAAAGFGAGIGSRQLTCGAVTGAVMAVGCRWADAANPGATKGLVYERTRQALGRFEALFGTTSCRELLGVDLNTPEGRAQAKAQDLFRVKCDAYVRAACGVVESMLADYPQP